MHTRTVSSSVARLPVALAMSMTVGLSPLLVAGCGNDVGSDDAAARAYLGLDSSLDKALNLGFTGFNTAKSANIAPQMTSGAHTGTLSISGQVDQGASDNKGMRLVEALVGYSDDGALTYDTDAASPPHLNLSLKKIPDGTLSGTLVGTYRMSGALSGAVTLDLSLSGTLQVMAGDATKVERKPGTTHITGTAMSPAGTFHVDIIR